VSTVLTRRLPLVAFVGTSGSGKTTAMEFVTTGLTRLGFRVGVAKHIRARGFTIDTKGKDTWRHARAGATVVVGVSLDEVVIIKKTSFELEFHRVIRELDRLGLDIVLIEGFSSVAGRQHGIPKIVLGRNKSDLARTLARTTPPILAVCGPVARDVSMNRKFRYPFVNVIRDGPILTSMIRRMLRPNEMQETLQKAAVQHGDACVGLAIGVRAAHLASSTYGLSNLSPKRIDCGTKQCIVEGIKGVFPEAKIRTMKLANDTIVFRSHGARLSLKLIPKRETSFARASQVLKLPENRIFQSVQFSN